MYNFDDVIDCKALDYKQIDILVKELRNEIIDSVSKNGGHLASNLGAVELTVAIHRVFNLPEDKLIFDVSHQSYVHKMLTGRKKGFEHLRGENGVSGFQLRSESEYDFFGGGHSGTSLSAAIGYAEACKLDGNGSYAVAVIGDGSFTNGMVYEALNNAAKENLRLIIIINDNEMSISENVGAMSRYFGRLRTSASYYKIKRRVKRGLYRIKLIGKPIARFTAFIKDTVKRLLFKPNLFENLGINYMGPVDGHNVKKLEAVLREAKLLEKPVIVHVCTHKGKGYKYAEESPELYHSVAPFDKSAGFSAEELSQDSNGYSSFSKCFGDGAVRLASENSDVVAISAAMCDGTGLSEFKEKYPERFFDVGIAEEHAVTFAAGLAAAGKKPIVAIYSSFLQRAYDQIIHDVAVQKLPVVFAIDRAGFVSGDGATHQGIFDCAFLLQIPNMTVYTPERYSDVYDMLSKAIESDVPVAVRYPKGKEQEYDTAPFKELESMRYARFGSGKKVSLITYGRTVKNTCDAARLLESEYEVTVVSIKRIKPFDIRTLLEICADSELLVFVEEQVKNGGASEYILTELASTLKTLPRVQILAVDGNFPTHASMPYLHRTYGMDAESICKLVKQNI